MMMTDILKDWDSAAQYLNKRIDELKEENKELKEDLAAITMMLMEDET